MSQQPDVYFYLSSSNALDLSAETRDFSTYLMYCGRKDGGQDGDDGDDDDELDQGEAFVIQLFEGIIDLLHLFLPFSLSEKNFFLSNPAAPLSRRGFYGCYMAVQALYMLIMGMMTAKTTVPTTAARTMIIMGSMAAMTWAVAISTSSS
jgi:hypothetical protein